MDQNENFKLLFKPIIDCFVIKGLKYRFRIISNGVFECPIQLSVDNHTLLVITSDGAPLKPIECNSNFKKENGIQILKKYFEKTSNTVRDDKQIELNVKENDNKASYVNNSFQR